MKKYYNIGIDLVSENPVKGAICIMKKDKIISIYNINSFWSRLRYIFDIWRYKTFFNVNIIKEINKPILLSEYQKSLLNSDMSPYFNTELINEMITFNKNYDSRKS